MARIALVAFYDYESLSVRLLHSVLRAAGHEPLSIFFKRYRLDRMEPPSEADYGVLAQVLDRAEPCCVGFSLRSTYTVVAKEAARRLWSAGHLILWGGAHATVHPEDALEAADAVCVGEGEGALLEALERLEAGRGLEGVGNLWVRDGDGICKAPMRPLRQDLDELPFPWWEQEGCLFIEDGRVRDAPPPAAMTSYDTMTSRGCPFRCTYCIHGLIGQEWQDLGRYLRRRSPESVIEELVEARERFPNLNRVRFWDDVFTAAPPEWMARFARLYRQEVGLPFWCYTTAGLAKPRTLAELEVAGLRYIGMGIQSGSERIRNGLFGRPDRDEQLLQAAQRFRRLGLHPDYDLIVDNPFEDEEDRRRTLELLLRLPRPFSLYQHSLTFFPRYGLTGKALEAGHIGPEDVEHRSAKGLTRWHDEFSRTRDRENTFWVTLYFLSQFRHVPQGLIRRLSRSGFFRRHPMLLNRLVEPGGRLALKARWVRYLLEERGLSGALRRMLERLTQGFAGHRLIHRHGH